MKAIIVINRHVDFVAGCSLFQLKTTLSTTEPMIAAKQKVVVDTEDGMEVTEDALKVAPVKSMARKKKYNYKRHLHVMKKKGSRRHKT